MSTKTIAVIGATGAQGGSLTRAALADTSGEWAVRAITRNPDGDVARGLAAAGAEVVRADLDDVESLTEAFDGAYGAFCVTNFWEHFSGAKEIEQARNLAQAAGSAGVQHVIWSTLEDTRDYLPAGDTRMPRLQGEYAVPHFDAKAEADKLFADLPTTYLRASFFWDNLYAFGLGPTKGDDGSYSVTFPMGDSPMAGIAAEDVGKVAFGVFKAGDRFIGKTFGIASEFLTIREMADGLEAVLPTGSIAYNNPEPDLYRTFGFPGADEMGNMFQIYRDFPEEFAAKRDTSLARELNPELQTYEQFLAKHKDKIPL
ncbi:NmrA/HSCARG family protein [Aeromicrobium terrae]|uniref:NmrA/HSCARG family protein n=1 Tax=Aeromicrobium terrae TaxID=2498846 RepID=A0A5C8NKU6_9ACTN|nr:NmrA/HSCARG family protein [Aeromicrobium terrae]TXL61411.1 NmrA/HSCARG family protein [Aeromicrobium terrae]